MRTGVAAAALLFVGVAGCGEDVITELSSCRREQGATEAYLEDSKKSQAAAEQKVAALEEQLRKAREEAAAAQSRTPEVVVEPGPGPQPLVSGIRSGAKVGLSLPTREERWAKDKLAMLAEAKRMGVELLVQVTDNSAKQEAQCDSLIAQGIKVLILAPQDASSAASIIDKAAAAGVAVISYDRLVTDSPHFYYYLSFDNVRVGEMQAEYLTKKVPKGVYILLGGSPTDNNAKLLREGSMRFIQPLVTRGSIKIVLDQFVKDWDPGEARRLCDEALGTFKNIDAVLAPNDGTAGGCIQALEAHGLAGKVPVTGQDAELAAAVRVNQGLQGMTVFKDTRQLARKAIEMASDLIRGRPIRTRGKTISNTRRRIPAVLLAPYLVTKENLDEVLVKSGYLNREALYRK